MTPLLYLALVCLTIIIVVSTISNSISAHKKRATELKAELDKRQIELAFPPEKPEKPTLEQQAFDVKRLREQQAIDTRHKATQQVFDAKKQALDHVLTRRRTLEAKIDEARAKVLGYADKQYAQYRTDSLEAMNDARKEQAELVEQQAKLLFLIQGADDESQVDAAQEPVQPAAGRPVAQRVDDSDLLHDAELHEPEAGRKGFA